MFVDSLQQFFTSSPAVRLLRSPHAYWIVDFLQQQFKSGGGITRLHSELAGELEYYLDCLAKSQLAKSQLEGKGEPATRERAESYLTHWCSNSTGWLKRYIDADGTEPCYQLTAESEKALAFVAVASREVRFVGTESRLRSIVELLGEVVAGVHDDPEIRLADLERQRAEIEREIARLHSSPASGKLSATQVRERFALAAQQLHQLKSEFRAVEDCFREITRGVQQRILTDAVSRGEIVQFALDREDMLKQGDQGRSFQEFLKLLYAPDSQERISSLIHQLGQIEALASEQADLASLREMVPALLAEAEKILRTTQHLSATLRRLLDARSTSHHQQLSHVLREILGEAARRSENPPVEVGVTVEVDLAIQSPMDRPFWTALEPFDDVELLPVATDEQQQQLLLSQLAALQRLDWQAMRRNITTLTGNAQEASLLSLLEHFPIQAGIIEILGYVQLAFDDGHRIDRTHLVEIPAALTGPLARSLRVPNITFLPQPARNKRVSSRQPRPVRDRPSGSHQRPEPDPSVLHPTS